MRGIRGNDVANTEARLHAKKTVIIPQQNVCARIHSEMRGDKPAIQKTVRGKRNHGKASAKLEYLY